MTSNSIKHKAERAVQKYIQPYLKRTIVGESIMVSDRCADLLPKPYVLIVGGDDFTEISPMSGVFKGSIKITFSSHVAESTEEQREAVCTAINNFTYSDPATAMSQLPDFYCHGVVLTAGEFTVDTEEKAFDYHTNFEIWCMPRDNS